MATAEFKKAVIETMQEERQSYSETAHRFEINDHKRICCTISDRPVLSMVTSMLDKAFDKLPDGTNLILHLDQGWQYQHKQYQAMLEKKEIRQGIRRKGNSMEHFKQEFIASLDYYNNRRIKAKLKDLPPALYRQQALSAACTIPVPKLCLTFRGHFIFMTAGFLLQLFYNKIFIPFIFRVDKCLSRYPLVKITGIPDGYL